MSGGFCEEHGPFDPPHTVCPYCVREGKRIAPPDGVPELRPPPRVDITQTASMPAPHPIRHVPTDDRDRLDMMTDIDANTEQAVAFDTLSPDCDIVLYLVAKTPLKARGRVFRVLPGQVIGRKDSDVLVNDKRISRQHARINCAPLEDGLIFTIYDFGTPNGTFVNGERVLGRMDIRENDEIEMGDHVFTLKVLTR